MKLDFVDSLFILSEQQKQDCEELQYYDLYFSLMRHEYMNNTVTISTMYDIWIYYYYEEQALYNSELTMIYLLRHYVVDKVLNTPKFQRIKMHTVGSYTKSLIAAALTVNIFCDINRKILVDISKEELALILKYSNSTRIIFESVLQKLNTYPKQLVHIETKMLQLMRQYINEHEEEFAEKIIEVVKFMDQYALDEKDIFERGILK